MLLFLFHRNDVFTFNPVSPLSTGVSITNDNFKKSFGQLILCEAGIVIEDCFIASLGKGQNL